MILYQKYKKWLIITLILFVLIGFYVAFFRNSPTSQLVSVEEETEPFLLEETEEPLTEEVEEEIEDTSLVIDIKGAVELPGVYEMQSGARVHHLIDEAGGLKSEADERSINLAAPLEDGMVIYIPKVGEVEESLITALPVGQEGDKEKVNINLATSDELQSLTGIGPSKAEAIITYREENGPFKAPEDLLEVSGIGEKSFEKIKEEIIIK
jgi:competence protein ComEA